MSRKSVFTILQIVLALILLGFILPQIDWKLFKTILTSYNSLYLGLLVGVALLDRFLMSYKWNLLLRSHKVGLPWFDCLRIYIIGNFLAAFLPAGVAGDFYRIYRLSSRVRSRSIVAASVLMERSLGLIALTAFALFSLLLMVVWKNGFMVVLVGPVALFLLAALVGFYLSVHFRPREWVVRFLPHYQQAAFLQKLFKLHDAYIEYRGQGRTLWGFFCLSFLEQFLLVGLLYLSVLTLNINIDLIYILGISPTCHILELLPISINAIGITEGLYLFFFSKIGVSATQVLSVVLLLRVLGLLMLMLGGVLYLMESLMFRKELAFPYRPDAA